jgi:uncharacterized membrane protein (UPF0127 family)
MKIVLAMFIALLLAMPAYADTLKTEPLAIAGADGKTHNFTVEIAATQDEQVRGLMNRKSMADDAGMLFVFDTLDYRAFWMKDTLIPLDMLFIDDKGKIIKIQENAKPGDLTSIPSGGPVLAVLELAGGVSAKLGLKAGDTVKYKTFGNTGG